MLALASEKLGPLRVVWNDADVLAASLLNAFFQSVHYGVRVASPNDPKLSDGGGWRDGCAGEGGGAASVTAGAVRCSAWLGDVRCINLNDMTVADGAALPQGELTSGAQSRDDKLRTKKAHRNVSSAAGSQTPD